jgi:hypothetical protein
MCSIPLPCGHACPCHCHPGTDSDHSSVKCFAKVEQTCPVGHKYFTTCAQATAAAAQAQRSPGAAAAVAAAATQRCSSCQKLKQEQLAEAKRRAAEQKAQQEAANAAAVALAEAQRKVCVYHMIQ